VAEVPSTASARTLLRSAARSRSFRTRVRACHHCRVCGGIGAEAGFSLGQQLAAGMDGDRTAAGGAEIDAEEDTVSGAVRRQSRNRAILGARPSPRSDRRNSH
jgi:hypothetical protein